MSLGLQEKSVHTPDTVGNMVDLFDPGFTILNLEDGAISDLTGSPQSMNSEGPSMDSEGLSEPAQDTTDSAPDTTYSTPPTKAPSRARQPTKRTVFSRRQLATLESRFCQQSFLSREERKDFASELGITERQVMIWFQNRRGRLKKRGPTDKAFNPCKLDELNTRRPYPLLYGMISSLNYHNPSTAQQLISMYPHNVQQTAQSALNYNAQPQQYNYSDSYRHQGHLNQPTTSETGDAVTIARLLSYQQKTQPKMKPLIANEGLVFSKYSSDPYKLQQCLSQTLQKEGGNNNHPSVPTPTLPISQLNQWNQQNTQIPDRPSKEGNTNEASPNTGSGTKEKEGQHNSISDLQNQERKSEPEQRETTLHQQLQQHAQLQQQRVQHQQQVLHYQNPVQHHQHHQQQLIHDPPAQQPLHCQQTRLQDHRQPHLMGPHQPGQAVPHQARHPSQLQSHPPNQGYQSYDYASLKYAAQCYYQPNLAYDYSAVQCSSVNKYTNQAPNNTQAHPWVM